MRAGFQWGSTRPLLVLATTTLVLAGVVPRFYNANPMPAIAPPPAAVPADTVTVAPRTVTIRRVNGGHFHLEALVDGQRMEFLADTGATGVALRESNAASIGTFIRPIVTTRPVRSPRVESCESLRSYDRVEVGHIVVHNVVVVVFPNRTLSQNLLGMSFLSRIRWQQEAGDSCSNSSGGSRQRHRLTCIIIALMFFLGLICQSYEIQAVRRLPILVAGF
jgi:aspartyl protease family protein